MQIFNIYKDIPQQAKGCVVVIGNFDGVHLGHQALLERARVIASDTGKKLGVLTFEPHPRHLFRPDEPPCRITSREIKHSRLELCGVDYLFSLSFDWAFASQSASDFVRNILVEGLAASHVIVGYDFKFGQLRQGNFQTIRDFGLPVSVVDKVVEEHNGDVSSSHIRYCLRHGKIVEANAVLGWSWEVCGEIIKGDQRGRALGYPTANMEMGDTIHPAYGVYACRAMIKGEDVWYDGVCNIGIRPMFEIKVAQIETFIFDFDRDIYGQILCVRPVERLRGEARFETLDALIVQMGDDCSKAREALKG